MRHCRARLDYDPGSGASHYRDAYGDRSVVDLYLCFLLVLYFYYFLNVLHFDFLSSMNGRFGRSNVGYVGGSSALSSHESHGLYSSRQGMGYGGGIHSFKI